ncbi:hypothetical protein NDU88_002187 [Pleurodeles waltl]|uniref:Uncharacterized protein n=1 Tax=Pleurodeles waltl TaxID=8319 RepID=A0AAV7LDJ2_PLEWA|nr:hypothetical protein NDU88_002187 [Pleurodeles waltl]
MEGPAKEEAGERCRTKNHQRAMDPIPGPQKEDGVEGPDHIPGPQMEDGVGERVERPPTPYWDPTAVMEEGGVLLHSPKQPGVGSRFMGEQGGPSTLTDGAWAADTAVGTSLLVATLWQQLWGRACKRNGLACYGSAHKYCSGPSDLRADRHGGQLNCFTSVALGAMAASGISGAVRLVRCRFWLARGDGAERGPLSSPV